MYSPRQEMPQAGWVRVRRIAAFAVLALVVTSGRASAEDLVGRASVVDGDTLEIRGEKIRLHGIDAPEASQRCTRPNGKEWRCGQQAANALSEMIGQRNVRCEGNKRDRWRRLIAVCFLGKQDLNAWLVRRGLGRGLSQVLEGLRSAGGACAESESRYLVRRLRDAVGLAQGAAEQAPRIATLLVAERHPTPPRA